MCARWCGAHKFKKVVYDYLNKLTIIIAWFGVCLVFSEQATRCLFAKIEPSLLLMLYSLHAKSCTIYLFSLFPFRFAVWTNIVYAPDDEQNHSKTSSWTLLLLNQSNFAFSFGISSDQICLLCVVMIRYRNRKSMFPVHTSVGLIKTNSNRKNRQQQIVSQNI